MTAPPEPEIYDDPLDVAVLWAHRVGAIADYWGERERADPGFGRIEANIHGAGQQQYQAAQMAAFMAQVSIAADLRRIADTLTVVPASEVGGQAEARWSAAEGADD